MLKNMNLLVLDLHVRQAINKGIYNEFEIVK
jgi:hypothetical protein